MYSRTSVEILQSLQGLLKTSPLDIFIQITITYMFAWINNVVFV